MFLLLLQRFFIGLCFLKFDFDVSWCEFLWVHPNWDLLHFFNLYVFSKVGKISGIISFSALSSFSSPSETLMTQMLNLWFQFCRTLRLCSFLFFQFIFSLLFRFG